MFQFPGFASNPYVFSTRYLPLTIRSPKPPAPLGTNALGIRIVEGGFPHSQILGSKLVRSSPRLIAAYHVLHRLSAPRHPPNALKALDRSHDRCPPLGSDKHRQKDHLLAEHTRLRNDTDVPPRPSGRSDAFPLHDDKEQAERHRPSRKPFWTNNRLNRRQHHRSRGLVEPDGIEPTTS